MIEMTLPPAKTERQRPAKPGLSERHRRVKTDAFLAELMNPAPPANRAERRHEARRTRRLLSALRAHIRDVKAKCEYRAERKARRLARGA